MTALVIDSGVWISLQKGSLLEAVFRLPVPLYSPDVLHDDLREPCPSWLESRGLQLLSVDGVAVLELMQRAPGLSAMDAACAVLAADNNWRLVTDERLLRQVAVVMGIEVGNTLFLLDVMIKNGIITRAQAARALQAMIAAGRRFPSAEVKRAMARWTR